MPPTQSSLKKQNGDYQPNTLHKWIFWFSPHVTYPDGIAQSVMRYISRLGTFKTTKGKLKVMILGIQFSKLNNQIMVDRLLQNRFFQNRCEKVTFIFWKIYLFLIIKFVCYNLAFLLYLIWEERNFYGLKNTSGQNLTEKF